MLNRLHKMVPLQIELIPFLITVFLVWYTMINFSRLPEIIPTHFNHMGIADGFGSKGEIFFIMGTGVFVYLLISGIGWAMALVSDPKTLINLPASIKNRIAREKAEDLRVFLVRCLFALKLLISFLMAFLVFGTIETAFNRWSGLGYWPGILSILVLALAFFMVYRSLQAAFSK